MRNQETGLQEKENKRKTGERYEQMAGEYLEKRGYSILEYNFRCPFAEIDMVARDKEYLVFCEVKYRKGKRMGGPLEAIDKKKQKRISMAALFYLSSKGIRHCPCRFDVVGITEEEIVLLQNAFDYIGG